MQLTISLEEGLAAIHYYYKNIKGYDIDDSAIVKIPKRINSDEIKFILNTKVTKEELKQHNKKIYWDEKCPYCKKNSLMIIKNNNIIVQQCLLCGFEDKDTLEEV